MVTRVFLVTAAFAALFTGGLFVFMKQAVGTASGNEHVNARDSTGLGNRMYRRARTWRLLLTSAGVVCVPVMVVSLYLIIKLGLHTRPNFLLDYLFLGLSVSAGASFILALPMRRLAKVVFAIAYIPIASGLLFVYMLVFACSVFHKCI
jgi:hypothetical protein